MSATRYVMFDKIKKIEESVAKKWVSGLGEHAMFRNESEGFYAVFESCPASVFLGTDAPELEAGNRVRLTLEKI